MRNMFLIFIICVISTQMMAQETKESVKDIGNSKSIQEKINSIKGTFQLICKNEAEYFEYEEILKIIEKKRDKAEVVYVKLTENTTLKILPENIINASGFLPLKEEYFVEK